jgi:hypothetical protein
MTITFQGEQHYIMDETPEFYICEPHNRNEGYHYVRKGR